MIRALLDGNRRFIANEYNTHLDYYKSIAQAQAPTVLWIGCSDSRVSESIITDSMPGTIFVHRNVANIVAFNDVNVAAIITCATETVRNIYAIASALQAVAMGDWLNTCTFAELQAAFNFPNVAAYNAFKSAYLTPQSNTASSIRSATGA